MFSKRDFYKLASNRSKNCLSVYLPTQQDIFSDTQNAQRLGKLILQLKQKLGRRGYTEKSIQNFVTPLKRLNNAPHFWTNTSDCLVIFATESSLDYFKLPIKTKLRFFLGERFYVKPLIPLISDFSEEAKQHAIEHFNAISNSSRTTSSIETIVRAADIGRVGTLFLQKGANLWGHYSPSTRIITTGNPTHETCLLNLSAMKSALQGGDILVLDKADMPTEKEACAILNY